MSQVSSPTALESFRITRSTVDPRADGGRRTVHVSASQVVIERVLQGVRMRIGVPVAAYGPLVVAVLLPVGRATLRLRHDDPDLDVTIAVGEAAMIAQAARDWAVVLGKIVAIERACITLGDPSSRRRRRAKPTGADRTGCRSAAARRHAAGSLERLGRSFAGEREIIARD